MTDKIGPAHAEEELQARIEELEGERAELIRALEDAQPFLTGQRRWAAAWAEPNGPGSSIGNRIAALLAKYEGQ